MINCGSLHLRSVIIIIIIVIEIILYDGSGDGRGRKADRMILITVNGR